MLIEGAWRRRRAAGPVTHGASAMRTSDLTEAWKHGRATSRDLAKSVASHARGAAHDARGAAHDLRGSALEAFHDLRDRAGSLKDLRTKSSRGSLPFSLGEARGFGRGNSRLLTAGGAVLGLAAGGALAWALVRKAREKKLAQAGSATIAPPADRLGRDAAHQGESGGLAEFVEPQSAPFPLAGGRRAKARTNISTEH
jgi:hypothetical protein